MQGIEVGLEIDTALKWGFVLTEIATPMLPL